MERALVACAGRDTARMRRFVTVFGLLIALNVLLVGNVVNASPALLDRSGATVRSIQIPIIAPPSSFLALTRLKHGSIALRWLESVGLRR